VSETVAAPGAAGLTTPREAAAGLTTPREAAAELDPPRAQVMQATATAQALQGLRAMVAQGEGGADSTGNQAVDAAVRAVRNTANLPVAEQFAAYEAAHETLREVLASIEE
jgi:hypothetical protein